MRDAAGDEQVWVFFGDIEPDFQGLARRLMEAGLREPQVGMEIPDDRDDVWAEAEMLWEDERVALVARESTQAARRKPAEGWRVFYREDLSESVEPILDALGHGPV
jgi:hypothetical protein